MYRKIVYFWRKHTTFCFVLHMLRDFCFPLQENIVFVAFGFATICSNIATITFLWQFANILQSCHRYRVIKCYYSKLSFATKYKASMAKFSMLQLPNYCNSLYFIASQTLLQKYIYYKNMKFVAI